MPYNVNEYFYLGFQESPMRYGSINWTVLAGNYDFVLRTQCMNSVQFNIIDSDLFLK